MRWRFWPKRPPTAELEEASDRLAAIEGDDVKVEELRQRAQRIMYENHLAPHIIRALRTR